MTLRELAEAAQAARKAHGDAYEQRSHIADDLLYAVDDAGVALADVLGVLDATDMEAVAKTILAALDAEREVGRREGLRAAVAAICWCAGEERVSADIAKSNGDSGGAMHHRGCYLGLYYAVGRARRFMRVRDSGTSSMEVM